MEMETETGYGKREDIHGWAGWASLKPIECECESEWDGEI